MDRKRVLIGEGDSESVTDWLDDLEYVLFDLKSKESQILKESFCRTMGSSCLRVSTGAKQSKKAFAEVFSYNLQFNYFLQILGEYMGNISETCYENGVFNHST